MRFPLPAVISSMWPPMLLLLWLVKELLLPGVEVLGAPTQTSVPARHSRGDRTVPPGSIDDGEGTERFLYLGDDIDRLVAERTRRGAIEVAAASADPAKEEALSAGRTQLSRSSRQSGHGTQGSSSGNAHPEPRMDSRKVHKTDSNEDYYYYYYYDSFVEGVTTRDDLDDYSENGAPVDLEDSEDDSDDGEIMELLNLAPRQKVT